MKPRKTEIPDFRRRINYTLKKYSQNRKYMLTEHVFGGYTLTVNGTELKNYCTDKLSAQMLIVQQLKQLHKHKTFEHALNL